MESRVHDSADRSASAAQTHLVKREPSTDIGGGPNGLPTSLDLGGVPGEGRGSRLNRLPRDTLTRPPTAAV
jgi:hypothetical protein